MDYRSILEVQKFLPLKTLLEASLVCALWQRVATSSELLHQLREDLNLPFLPFTTSADSHNSIASHMVLKNTLASLSKSLHFYRCDVDRWTHHADVDKELQGIVDYSALFLPDSSLLVTGGEVVDVSQETRKQFRHVYCVSRDGTYKRLKNMCQRRKSHGLVLFEGVVYALGGRGLKGILNLCEKLGTTGKIQSKQWEEMQSMMLPRHSFNPCAARGRVFICGGDTLGKCEVFDVHTGCFAPLPLKLSPYTRSACCFLDHSDLLVLTSERLYRWRLDTTEPPSSLEHDKKTVYGQMSPVLCHDCIFVLSVLVNPRVWIYDLRTNQARETEFRGH